MNEDRAGFRWESWADLALVRSRLAADDPPQEILRNFPYRDSLAYCCGYVGLRLDYARAIAGPADHWVRLPERDYWAT